MRLQLTSASVRDSSRAMQFVRYAASATHGTTPATAWR